LGDYFPKLVRSPWHGGGKHTDFVEFCDLKHEIVKFKEAPMFKQSAECSRLQGK
jgi:hypothetical protein